MRMVPVSSFGTWRPLARPAEYVVTDFGLVGDGVTLNDTAWANLLTTITANNASALAEGRGASISFPRGVYMFGSTMPLTIPAVDVGGLFGGMLTIGNTTIKAAVGFTGSLIKINIASGEKGIHVHDLMLDGASLANVGVEYANGTIANTDLININIVNVPAGSGILTGTNQQSYAWTNVESYSNVGVGVTFGANSRHITATNCIFGGTSHAAVIGIDTNVSADSCNVINLLDCEFYGYSNSTDLIQVLNANSVNISNSWLEGDPGLVATIDAHIVVGGTNARPANVNVMGNRFVGNNKIKSAVKLVASTRPVVAFNFTNTLTTAFDVLNNDTTSFGIVFGHTSSSQTGLIFSMGETTLANPQYHVPFSSGQAAGFDAFQAWVTGESNARYAIRNNAGLMGGAGSAPADVTLGRASNATWIAGNNLSATGYLQVGGTSGNKWTNGTGSPEGVVTGIVGDLYTNLTGGAGTTLFVKQTGTGNTGWIGKVGDKMAIIKKYWMIIAVVAAAYWFMFKK